MTQKSIIQYLSLIVGLSLFAAPVSLAQTPTSTSQGLSSEQIQEVLEFRKQLLEILGIPEERTTSIFDIFKPNTDIFTLPDGTTLPPLGSQGPLAGPLSDLRISLSTKKFSPGEQVTATLLSNTANLSQAIITWRENGAVVLSGKGRTQHQLTVGPLGSTQTIQASVVTDEGASHSITEIIRPARIHFTWFADTYTPAWYRGKALPVFGSRITIVAMPEVFVGGARVSPGSLSYEWAVNGAAFTTHPSISGRGKNTYALDASPARGASYTIGVRVRDAQGTIIHENSVTPSFTEPTVAFYKRDPLYGISQIQMQGASQIQSGQDLTLHVEPFFIQKSNLLDLSYTWRVNGTAVGATNQTNRALRISTEEGSKGLQEISVSYQDKNDIIVRGGGQTTINVEQ